MQENGDNNNDGDGDDEEKQQTNKPNVSENNKNKSQETHSRFDYDKVRNEEIYKIIESFSGALRDVVKCLNDSYSRFHITNEYKLWHKRYVLNEKHGRNNSKLRLRISAPIDQHKNDDEKEK